MSQMDEIQAALENNSELKQAVEQAGQSLNANGVEQINESLPPNDIDKNSNDSGELYRSLDSDVGNMNAKEIPDSVKQEAVNVSQMDRIEAQESTEISSPNATPEIAKEDHSMER